MKKKLALILIIATSALFAGSVYSTILYANQYVESAIDYAYSVVGELMKWITTTQGDFECSGPSNRSNVDTWSSPENVTLGKSPTWPYWWNSSWQYRMLINITDNSGSILTNYQVLITLNPKIFNYSKADGNGDDIRFTLYNSTDNNESALSYWIEAWNTSGESKIWVNVTKIPANGISTIYMYYGTPGASAASNFDATFTKDFGESGLAGLWHMDDGSGTNVSDSSGNGNHGTLTNGEGDEWVGSDGGQWDGRSDVSFSTGDSLSYTSGAGTETLRPNGAGSSTQCANSGCTFNWQCVDEVIADEDSTYVRPNGLGEYVDTYAAEDSGVGSGTINSVTVYVRVRRTGTFGTCYGRTELRTHGTTYGGTQFTIPTGSNYANYSTEYTTNPNTDSTWTWTEVNDMEIGVGMQDVNPSNHAYCTQVWAVVNFGGTDDYVNISDDTSLDVTNVTLSAWVKSNATGRYIVAKDAPGWIGINSSHYDSHCGDSGFSTLAEALDGTDSWEHWVDEEHWFILDLGQTYTIEKVRGRSDSWDDPTDVEVYVSDSKTDWGTAVATNINTWQDTSTWQEVDTTDKDGRYIRVLVKSTEDFWDYVEWGEDMGGPFAIFDAYGDVAGKSDVPYALSTVGGGQFLIMSSGTTYTANSTTDINDGNWHHIAGTYDGSSMKIYIDGVLEDTNTDFSGNLPTNDGNVRIGADYQITPANFFNGTIDEVRIYNRALSAGEIKCHYERRKYTSPEPTINMGAEESNTTWMDYFGGTAAISTSTNVTVSDGDVELVTGSSQWWNNNWAYRKQLTFDNSGQSEALVNFTVLINLSSSNFDYSKAKPDGTDLRFIDADGSTELKYHIEDWNSSGYSYVWVNVTNIDASSSTDYIWMYYNNSAATDVQDESGTYDDSYVGVWHLNETGTGTRYDSTSNNNDGTPQNYDGDEATNGDIDGADDLDGTNDYIQTTSGESQTSTSFTWECWFKTDNTTGAHHLMWEGLGTQNGWGSGASGTHEAHLNIGTYDLDNVIGCFYGTNEVAAPPAAIRIDSSFSDTTNFHYAVFVVTDAGTSPSGELFLDGVSVGTDTGDQTSRTDWDTDLRIGSPGAAQRYFNGIIDEVRVSTIARSADWINAQYLSMNDSFITYGSEEIPSLTTTGNLTSIAITPGNLSGWDKFYADDTINATQGTNITYKILNASDNSVLCTITSAQANAGYDISSYTSGVASIKLYAELTTTNTSNTPILHDWNVSWHRSYYENGYLISCSHDVGSATNYHNISWNATIPSETTLKFQIATNNDNATWNFLGPDGSALTYYTLSGTDIWSGHDGDRYIKYKAYFETTNTSKTPILEDVTITYTGG